MGNRNMFVRLDVHKDTVDVSIAEGDRRGEVRHDGVIASGGSASVPALKILETAEKACLVTASLATPGRPSIISAQRW
jgi:hypothetical protein